MRLRYTGPLPVTFPVVGAEVEPGGEFEVPDEAAPPLLARADVTEAGPEPAARRRPPKSERPLAAGPDPAGAAPDPMTVEVSGGVSDDH